MLVAQKAKELKQLQEKVKREWELYRNVAIIPSSLKEILKQEEFWEELHYEYGAVTNYELNEINCNFVNLQGAYLNRQEFFEKLQNYIEKVKKNIKEKEQRISELQKELEEAYQEYFQENSKNLRFIFASDDIRKLIIDFLIN